MRLKMLRHSSTKKTMARILQMELHPVRRTGGAEIIGGGANGGREATGGGVGGCGVGWKGGG